MKETQHLQRALELLNEPTMQFGAAHRRKRRYQPYPHRSRPETYKARAYFPRLHQFRQGRLEAHFEYQPGDQLFYEIEFVLLSFNKPCNCILVRVLDIKEYDHLGNRKDGIRNFEIGKTVQLKDYPPRLFTTILPDRTKLERVPVPRVRIGYSPQDETGFLDKFAWFTEVPFTTLYNAVLAKTRHNQPWGHDEPPHTVSRLEDLAKAALTPAQKVSMARNDPDNYFYFTNRD